MAKSRIFSTHYTNGFTIIELLVVIVIIGILAAITIVSYTGVTSRADIASMQSNLTDASTILRLDQIKSGNFPATLALADDGAGITPNQSLDGFVYVPDNTSSPKNFCLEYRKGTNAYAIEDESTPVKGVCLKNLINNGNFSQGTTGWWSSHGATLTALNNECYFTPAAQYDGIQQVIANYADYKSHVLYYATSAKASSSSIYLILNDGVAQGTVNLAVTGSYTRLSGLLTVSPNATNLFIKLQDYRSSGWTADYVKYWVVIDLTTAFGAGNEPTKAQMDTIMNDYTNSWFNIVAKANL